MKSFSFLIVITGLPKICNNSHVSFFAVDPSVYTMNKNSESKITETIQAMTGCFNNENKSSVNNKCESIGFREPKLVIGERICLL